MSQQNNIKFRFTLEDYSIDYLFNCKDILTRFDVIEKIMQTAKERIETNEILKKFKINYFLLYSALEIFSIDDLGNYAKYNLIELVFDKDLFSLSKMIEFYSKKMIEKFICLLN